MIQEKKKKTAYTSNAQIVCLALKLEKQNIDFSHFAELQGKSSSHLCSLQPGAK